MIDEVLQDLDLTKEERAIYLSLLEKGAQSAQQLAKTTSVKRTYVYRIGEQLLRKGLVSFEKKGRATIFAPNSPDHLLSLVHDKKDKAAQTEKALEGILSTLKTKFSAIDTRPVVSYYEGVQGVKKTYLEQIKDGKDIDALVQTSQVDSEIYEWLTARFSEERIKNGIHVRAIVPSGQKTNTYVSLNKEELRETKIVSDKYNFQHEINVFGDKVAIINNKKGENLFGIVIDSKVVAETFRIWFELTWSKV